MLAQVSAAAESIVRPQTARTDSSHHLNIGISVGALFDTRVTDRILARQGDAAFREHLRRTEQLPYAPGAAFPFVQKLLTLNAMPGGTVKLTLLSQSSPHIAPRVQYSLLAHGLLPQGGRDNILTGAAYTGGSAITPPLLTSFGVDFFISRHAADVHAALAAGKAAGLVRSQRAVVSGNPDIVVAFDLDRVLQRPSAQVIPLFESAAAAVARRKWQPKAPPVSLLEQLEAGMPRVPEPGSLAAFLVKAIGLRRQRAITAPDAGQIHLMGVSAEPKLMPRIMQALRGWQADLDKVLIVKSLPGQIPLGAPADLLIDDSANPAAAMRLVRANIWLPWEAKRVEQGMPRPLVNTAELRQVVGPDRPAANTPLNGGDKPRVN